MTGLSREFKPRSNGLASLGLLSYSAIAGATLQLLACLARVHHSGGLQLQATCEIQPQVPISLHKLEQFFTLSHTLSLHDSHLNTVLLIAKIQSNLARNIANKMVDKIQPYNLFLISLYLPKKITSDYCIYIHIVNLVFKARLKGLVPLLLRESYVIFINFKR